MEKQKKTYEEVFSSEFSEESSSEESMPYDSDSSMLSEEIFDSKKITRDFWVKKDETTALKKEKKKKTDEKTLKETKSDEAASVAQSYDEADVFLDQREILNRIVKIFSAGSRRTNELDNVKNSLLDLQKQTNDESCLLLIGVHLLENFTREFEYKKGEEWEDLWQKSTERIKSILDSLSENSETVIEEYERLVRFCDADNSKDKFQIILKGKMSKEFLMNSISSFAFTLNTQLREYLKTHDDFVENSKNRKKFSKDNVAVLESAKALFYKLKANKNLLFTATLLLDNKYLNYDEALDVLNESRANVRRGFHGDDLANEANSTSEIERAFVEKCLSFSVGGFEKNEVQSLAAFLLINEESIREKEKALLKLVTHWAIHNKFEEAKRLLALLSPEHPHIKKVGTDLLKECEILYNRTYVLTALSCFRNGDYEWSRNLKTNRKFLKKALGQSSKEIKESFPSEQHISFDHLDIAFYFTNVFSDAVDLCLRSVGYWSEDNSINEKFQNSMNSLEDNDNGNSIALTKKSGNTQSVKALSARLCGFLAKADWRSFEAELRIFEDQALVFSMHNMAITYDNMVERAKEVALFVFVVRYGPQARGVDLDYLSKRFEVPRDRIVSVVERELVKVNSFIDVNAKDILDGLGWLEGGESDEFRNLKFQRQLDCRDIEFLQNRVFVD